jgi:hypothetical protein
MNNRSKNLADRVRQSAEFVLKANGSIGPLDLLQQLGFLSHFAFQQWQKGHEMFLQLEPHIQCGPDKLAKTWRLFLEWVHQNQLEAFEVPFCRSSRNGSLPLQITISGDPESEAFFQTRFRRSDLSESQKTRQEKKLNKPPELVVYQIVSSEFLCSECRNELQKYEMILLESGQALCLSCADLDHLEFLPSGNVAMTRRSKKLSPLSAVVVRFNSRRKRYERQGLLVASAAIDATEEQCNADAESRAVRREIAAQRRAETDKQLIEEMTSQIIAQFPGCAPAEAREIAAHTAVRGSGRVGRSAAGRQLLPESISLAVGAWVRHQHTNYDSLLMNGIERQQARELIRDQQQAILKQWSEKVP